jgi:hypothetical protein
MSRFVGWFGLIHHLVRCGISSPIFVDCLKQPEVWLLNGKLCAEQAHCCCSEQCNVWPRSIFSSWQIKPAYADLIRTVLNEKPWSWNLIACVWLTLWFKAFFG